MKKSTIAFALLIFGVILLLSNSSAAQLLQAGNLDNTFGNAGKIRDGFGSGYDKGRDLVIQPDGKIVVVGNSADGNFGGISVARYNADGTPDYSFGNSGKTLNTALKALSQAVALQTDGKIVVTGETRETKSVFFAVRFNSDGSVDKGFGVGGTTTVQFGTLNDRAVDISILPDGKIILAGTTAINYGIYDYDFAFARLKSDGSLDVKFGNSGKIVSKITNNTDVLTSIAVQTDGKILAVGKSDSITGFPFPSSAFTVVRYDQDGTIDRRFGNNGIISIYGYYAQANSVVLQSDGKIVVAGARKFNDPIVARFLADGRPDSSFGASGIVSLPLIEDQYSLKDIAIQPDGKIVGIGSFTVIRLNSDGTFDGDFGNAGVFYQDTSSANFSNAAVEIQPDEKIVIGGRFQEDFAAVRLTNRGTRDLRFGRNGLATTDVGNISASIRDLVVQNDGKIVTVGYAKMPKLHFAVARYNSDGSPDASFGNNGKVFTTINSENCEARKVILQTDGKIIVAGSTLNGQIASYGNYDFVFVRYNTDGTIDETFGNNGKTVTDFGSPHEEIMSVIVQPDGKILALGGSNSSYIRSNLVARYNADGSLDTSFGDSGKTATYISENYVKTIGMVLQTGGKILVIGNDYNNIVLMRYNPDGAIDSSFGNNGKSLIANSNTNPEFGYDVIAQPDGKIIVVGLKYLPFPNHNDSAFQLTRINADGLLDSSFGNNGKVITLIRSGYTRATSAALQPDGKIIAAGFSSNGNDLDFAVVRYNQDGSPDRLFCNSNCSPFNQNKVIINLSPGDDIPFAVKTDNEGGIIVAGESAEVFSMVRLTGNFSYNQKTKGDF